MNQIRELLLVDGSSPYGDWFNWEGYKRRKAQMAKDAVKRRNE